MVTTRLGGAPLGPKEGQKHGIALLFNEEGALYVSSFAQLHTGCIHGGIHGPTYPS